MCDWPSSPIIWFEHAVEGGLGRRAERQRLVLGAHRVPVERRPASCRSACRAPSPGGVQDRPPQLRCARRRGSRAWRARRPANGGGSIGRGRRAGGRSAGAVVGGRRRRGRRAAAPSSAAPARPGRPAPRAWTASARPAAAPARAAAVGAREPGDVAAREHARRRWSRARSSTTAANPPRAASNATRAPCWRGSSDAGAGSGRHRDQIARVERPRRSRPRRRELDARAAACRPARADDGLARERRPARRSTPAPPAPRSSGAAVGAASRMTTRPPARHGPDAPAERQPAAGARGDHARAIVVGERQVLIVAARRVERAPRAARARRPAVGRHRQHARARRRRPRPPG